MIGFKLKISLKGVDGFSVVKRGLTEKDKKTRYIVKK
jgi:hypothetical protein